MSAQKRLFPSSPPPSTHELKHRVITCLNKLADRDTLSVATSELESIAKTLTQDSFSSFINCLQNTDPSSKSPVRKQCVNLLTLLSHSHGNSLSPHLSKMMATVSRRLRDSDSSVRSACIVATTAISSHITKPSFSVMSKPLVELILVEQDVNSQVGGAMCLAAAIEATPNPEVDQLRKLLPRLGKAVRTKGFKAKAAVLGVIGSVVAVGGAKSKGILNWLVPCVIEFLSCDDWTARKVAAEVLGKVAVVDKELAADYKSSCLSALESRRFDKVKVVRETMNRSLKLWKEVAGVYEGITSPSPSKSSSTDNGRGGCFPSLAKSSQDVGFRTPHPMKTVTTGRSPPPDTSSGTTAKTEISFKSNSRKSSESLFCNLDNRKSSDWKVEIAVPRSPSSKVTRADHNRISDSGVSRAGEMENNVNCQPETKSVIFSKDHCDKVYKFGGSRYGSRIVPYDDDDNSDFVVNGTEEVYDYPKDPEDFSLIHEQLLRIENQQSGLLDLLQRFIGSSQSGLNYLETRVRGLEMALDEISYDLALSNGRIPNSDFVENTCCRLPGAEFLSSKFWRRAESRFSTSRLSSSGRIQSLHAGPHTPSKDVTSEAYKTDNQNLQHPNNGRFDLNPLADVHDPRGNPVFHSYRKVKNTNKDAERLQVYNAGTIDGATSTGVCVAPLIINSSLST